MLLYAKTEGAELESESWSELGHTYHVRTLDLTRILLASPHSLTRSRGCLVKAHVPTF